MNIFETIDRDKLPTLIQLRDEYVRYVLTHTNGRKTKAAEILGINRRTLYRKSLKTTRMRGSRETPAEVSL